MLLYTKAQPKEAACAFTATQLTKDDAASIRLPTYGSEFMPSIFDEPLTKCGTVVVQQLAHLVILGAAPPRRLASKGSNLVALLAIHPATGPRTRLSTFGAAPAASLQEDVHAACRDPCVEHTSDVE